MGTSGAYGGSGGQAWSRARRRARRLPPNPTDGDLDRLIQAVGDGLSHDNPELDQQAPAQVEPAAPTVSWGPISARPRAGGGEGPGTGGGRRGGGERPTGGGTRRSPRRVASVGSRAARAGAALLTGDTRTLAELGLDLADLVGLSPAEQAQRIAAHMVTGDSIENAEIRAATDALILAQIQAGRPLSPVEVAQVYASAWIIEVVKTELGAAYRDGSRPADEIRRIERRVYDTVRASVEGLVTDGMETMDTEAVITEVLGRARRVMRASGMGR